MQLSIWNSKITKILLSIKVSIALIEVTYRNKLAGENICFRLNPQIQHRAYPKNSTPQWHEIKYEELTPVEGNKIDHRFDTNPPFLGK